MDSFRRMRPGPTGRLFVAAVICAASIAMVACSGGREVSEEDMLRAQVTIAPFKSELVGALTSAVAKSPVDAIGVCTVQAPMIAHSLSRDGITVGRTSPKLRNPENSPQGWTHRWLRHYLDDPKDREPHGEYLDAKTIGYVEPIFIKPLCLTCHGKTLAPQIEARIDSLYPDDRARGYDDGDFRGLFWMTMPAGDG